MKFLRFLLFPLAFLYGILIRIRHFLYDNGWKKSTRYSLPIICIGNLSIGGTGKTPMTEFLIQFLKKHRKVAVVSRGYKRKTKGLIFADAKSTAETLGDEPFLYHKKHTDIQVVVSKKRTEAVDKLIENQPNTQVVVLDDAFQHRKIQAGFSIILTTFQNLFTDDFLLPMGELRDIKSRASKADCIIVTKCPSTLSEKEKNNIIKKIKPKSHQSVFFTTIKYSDFVHNEKTTQSLNDWIKQPFTLVTGIANPTPLMLFLKQKNADFKQITFPDHHNFSSSEIEKLKQEKRILTTEKDFVRLYPKIENVHYLPIEIDFLFEQAPLFEQKIMEFVT